jgi:hypothetical protein
LYRIQIIPHGSLEVLGPEVLCLRWILNDTIQLKLYLVYQLSVVMRAQPAE